MLVELAHLFVPDDVGRRFTPANPRHLQLAEQLLHVVGPPEEIHVLSRDRLALVLEYCRDYADCCRSDCTQAKCWGPRMLSTQPSAPGRQPAWDVLVSIVDTYRRQRRDAAAAAEEQRARAESARREAAQFDQRRVDHVAAAAALADAPFMRRRDPIDEPRQRAEGQRRQAQAHRAEVDDAELRRKINRALLDARTAKGDTLTSAEADEIRRRCVAEVGRCE
jgi:hypothetical protein